jgi:hypothetical protein
MRANLARGTLLHEVAAVAVDAGRVQLQRHTYTNAGSKRIRATPTVEPLSGWVTVDHVKPSLGMLMFHVRAANAYADHGSDEHARQAMIAAHRCLQP